MLGGVSRGEVGSDTTGNRQDSGMKRQWQLHRGGKGIKLHSQFLVIRAEKEARLQSTSKVLRWRWWGLSGAHTSIYRMCIDCGEWWLDPPYVREVRKSFPAHDPGHTKWKKS